MKRAVAGIWIAVAAGCAAHAAELAHAVESPVYVCHWMVVPRPEFTEDNLTALAREFAGQFRGVPFARLVMAPDTDGLFGHQSWSEGKYRSWFQAVNRDLADGREPRANYAEADVVGGQATLRLRISHRVSRVVLTERDPLLLEEGGHRYEILHIEGRLLTEAFDDGRQKVWSCTACPVDLRASLQTQPPLDPRGFRKVAARLASPVRPIDLSLSLRTDTVFVGDTFFPLLYEFGEGARFPGEKEYQESPRLEARCNGHTGRIRLGGGKR